MLQFLKMKYINVLLLLLQFQIISLNKAWTLADTNTDRDALLHFKSMVYDPQNALSGWNSSSSHCHWYGVTCNNAVDRVQLLRLGGLGLSGIITPHLSNLTSLEVLHLFNNSFYGLIPWEFSRLTLLQDLDVTLNDLTGAIPPSFGNLSSLTALSLARNKFFGNIPNELGHLQNLQILQLSENGQLTGQIPPSILNISSLVYLSLTDNNHSGELPASIGPNLKQLFLANNKLEGQIPIFSSNASKMQVLDLSSNNFQGTVPVLGNMRHLVKLNLGRNNLTSTTELNIQIFSSLTKCVHLQFLMLNSNQLTGELPSSVANLSTHLQEFCVDDNSLTGSFPQGFEKFQNLTALAVHQNSFTGEIPSSIGKLQQLQRFMVHQNMFAGSIPDIFGNLTQLYVLTMGFNQFSGRIPASIGICQRLFTLGLYGNRLDGSIPEDIFGISSLSNLYLAQNALTGSLPVEVGGLRQIEVVDISNNLLSGNIPTTIGMCLSLRNLNMASNQLNGLIPTDSVGKLAGLETLDLSSNNLSGPIPEDLENLRVLLKLNLSFNNLEGQVPIKGVFMNLSSDSLQGNDKLCGSDQEAAERLRVPLCITKEKSNGHLVLKIVIPMASFIVVMSAIFIMSAFIFRKKREKRKGSFSSLPVKGTPQLISYSEIWHATNGFATENLIGKGGFGSVYKGTFGPGDDGVYTSMAIKVIDFQISKAFKSFNAECEALRNVRHRNLVKVFTSCSSIDHKGAEFKALIMEFMTNGNLDQWLYPQDAESGRSLNLGQRLNIAIDVASAMDYLHNDCEPPVVHCDLKPGNILLDDNMIAHVGDFGLARFLSPNPNESSTIGLKGSMGYIAPEYGLGGKASTKGDVYSFGVLLLELFTARKPTDEMFQEGLNLNKFASEEHVNHVLGIVDPRLLSDNEYSKHSNWTRSYGTDSISYSSSSSSSIAINNWRGRSDGCLAAMIRVGLSCASQLAKDRLTMRETLSKLHEIRTFLLS